MPKMTLNSHHARLIEQALRGAWYAARARGGSHDLPDSLRGISADAVRYGYEVEHVAYHAWLAYHGDEAARELLLDYEELCALAEMAR